VTLLRLVLVGVLIAVAAPQAAPRAADPWVEVKSQNFTVFSDAGERKARQVAWQFEQVRAAIVNGWPWVRVSLNRPVVVYAAKDENSMKALLPGYWERRGESRPASVFVTRNDRVYVALRADVEADDQLVNPYNQAFWAYSALVIGQSFPRGLPIWLSNGLANVLSNTIISEKSIAFGRPLPWLTERLPRPGRLPLNRLLGVTQDSAYFRDSRDQFDTQSWALVQYMIFGQRGDMSRFGEVVRLLLEGTPSDEAVTKAFGPLATVDEAYWTYATRGVFTIARLQVESDTSALKVPARQIPEPEQAVIRARLHAAFGRPADARTQLAEARKAKSAPALADEVEGLLFDDENREEQAGQAFARAVEAGSTDFWAPYRLALIQHSPGANQESLARTHAHLERAVALNPDYGPAHSFLAIVRLGLGQHEPALDAAVRGVRLEPSSVYARLSLGESLARAARYAEAETVAREASAIAQTDDDRRNVAEFLRRLAARRAVP
jgi:tetratricopeptide (TPR) repeat protein